MTGTSVFRLVRVAGLAIAMAVTVNLVSQDASAQYGYGGHSGIYGSQGYGGSGFGISFRTNYGSFSYNQPSRHGSHYSSNYSSHYSPYYSGYQSQYRGGYGRQYYQPQYYNYRPSYNRYYCR